MFGNRPAIIGNTEKTVIFFRLANVLIADSAIRKVGQSLKHKDI